MLILNMFVIIVVKDLFIKVILKDIKQDVINFYFLCVVFVVDNLDMRVVL